MMPPPMMQQSSMGVDGAGQALVGIVALSATFTQT
jgi:hypothetical protein